MKISRRTLLGASLALPFGAPAFAADAPALPILPLATDFSYWDHYWFQPLDGHPLYQSVEVAFADPVIRLAFTERASQRQALYCNDSATAQALGAQFATIQLNRTGAANAPQNLSLSFTDKSGAAVKWEIRFSASDTIGAQAARLSQIPAREALSFWYANAGAATLDARITIGSAQYQPKESATYSPGAYAVSLLYGASEITPTADGFRSSLGDRGFVRAGGRYIARQPNSNIELRAAADNALLAYRHGVGRRTLALDFDGALAIQGKPVGFDLEVDNRDIASGTVTPTAAGLQWEFAEPSSARKPGLFTAITPRANGGYAIKVAPR